MRAVQAAGSFQTYNDNAIQDVLQERKQKKLERDRVRMRNARARLTDDAGKLLPEVQKLLQEERELRKICLTIIELSGRTRPPRLRHLDDATCDNTAIVWMTMEAMKIEGIATDKINPSSVATRLLALDSSGPSHAVLRDRVKKDMKRIEWIESCPNLQWDEMIWDPFEIRKALPER